MKTELESCSISTTTLSHVSGFTEDLVLCLKNGLLRTHEIAEITEKPRPYVHSYLKRMRNYQLARKSGSFWELTEQGTSFLFYLEGVKERKKESRHLDNTKITHRIHLSEIKPKQVSLTAFLLNSTLDDTEKRVVEILIEHYNKTGSKFIMVHNKYELAEETGINPQLLGDALANLVQDNRIYVFFLRGEGYTKIGLKKAFIESLVVKP